MSYRPTKEQIIALRQKTPDEIRALAVMQIGKLKEAIGWNTGIDMKGDNSSWAEWVATLHPTGVAFQTIVNRRRWAKILDDAELSIKNGDTETIEKDKKTRYVMAIITSRMGLDIVQTDTKNDMSKYAIELADAVVKPIKEIAEKAGKALSGVGSNLNQILIVLGLGYILVNSAKDGALKWASRR